MLREELDRAAAQYRLAARAQVVPSQHSMAKHYETVEAALGRAVAAMLRRNREARNRLHTAIGMGLPGTDVRRAIVTIVKLKRAARWAAQRKRSRPLLDRSERHRRPGAQWSDRRPAGDLGVHLLSPPRYQHYQRQGRYRSGRSAVRAADPVHPRRAATAVVADADTLRPAPPRPRRDQIKPRVRSRRGRFMGCARTSPPPQHRRTSDQP